MSMVTIAALAITALIMLLVIVLGYVMLSRYTFGRVQNMAQSFVDSEDIEVDPEAQIVPDLSPNPSDGMQAIAEQVKAQGLPIVPPVPMPAANMPVDPNPSVDVPQVSISDDNSEIGVRSDSIPPGRLLRDRRFNRNST